MEAAAMAQMNGDLEETGAKRRLDDFQEFQVEDAGHGCRPSRGWKAERYTWTT